MTVSADLHEELQWDMADRLRKTLRRGDISVQEMADYLEVSRNTVSAWINGRYTPRRRDLKQWSLRTGVPLSWLETGEFGDGPDGGAWCARRDSNPKPSDP